jgi:hypothetical protein
MCGACRRVTAARLQARCHPAATRGFWPATNPGVPSSSAGTAVSRPAENREELIVGFEDAKADIKKTMREADETAKETWRKADGEESVSDKVANLGDDIRKELGNAGDDFRRGADKLDDDVEDRPV